MWADELSRDGRATAAVAVGRIGELVSDLHLDHVALVATMVDPNLNAEEVLLELKRQVGAHEQFVDRIRRILANLQMIMDLLESVNRDEP